MIGEQAPSGIADTFGETVAPVTRFTNRFYGLRKAAMSGNTGTDAHK